MKVTRISGESHQLTKLGLMNCYLVREEDGFTLIDTTMGAAKDILAAAHSLGAPIKRILLTHAHADHIGSLDAIAETMGGTPGSAAHLSSLVVAIGARESRLLPKKPKQDLSTEPGEPPCKIKGSYPGAKTPATHALMDGEMFGSLRCIATPGHTPGHFSYLDERDGTLYAGDAMVTVGGSPNVPGYGPWFFPFPKFATWDRPMSVRSVERLTTFPVQRIAPGHGAVLEGGAALIHTALAKTKG